MVRITALMDDRAGSAPNLAAEHGLSLYVEYGDRRILFDCGQSGRTLDNARALGVPLEEVDAVVLSHGHYDHAGGYRAMVEAGLGGGRVFTGPGFFRPRQSRDGGGVRNLSPDFGPDLLEAHRIVHREIRGEKELFPGVLLFSDFPRVCPFEKIPARFLRETEAGLIPDDFSDEICMALRVSGGLLLLVGCAHPGIVNMARHIAGKTGERILGIIGGIHLVQAEQAQIRETLRALPALGLELLGLGHCSGAAAEEAAAALPGIRSFHLCPGEVFSL